MNRHAQIGGPASAVLLTVIAAACTAMSSAPVEGWPALKVVEHRVPHKEMRNRCAKYVAFLESPEACAEWDLAARTCDIYYSADFPPPALIVRHERAHCQGYQHAHE